MGMNAMDRNANVVEAQSTPRLLYCICVNEAQTSKPILETIPLHEQKAEIRHQRLTS